MSVLRSHSCGHLQRICTRCLSTGCDDSNCIESIGENSRMVCKVCGCNDVVSMENYQYTKQARAQEEVNRIKKTEQRIKKMETTRAIQHRSSGGGGVNIFGIFSIRNIVIVMVCFVLSNFMNYKEYDGIAQIVVGLINILGAIPAIIYTLLLSFTQ